jgi:flagellar biosynthetic protein FliP
MTRKIIFILLILTTALVWGGMVPFAEAISLPSIQLGMDDVEDPEKVSSALQILFLLTILTLAPSILILTTSFARIIIVLSFLRQAMGTQQTPPTQILIGLGS